MKKIKQKILAAAVLLGVSQVSMTTTYGTRAYSGLDATEEVAAEAKPAKFAEFKKNHAQLWEDLKNLSKGDFPKEIKISEAVQKNLLMICSDNNGKNADVDNTKIALDYFRKHEVHNEYPDFDDQFNSMLYRLNNSGSEEASTPIYIELCFALKVMESVRK